MILPYHFVLVDTNEHFFNCGHYPEWDVVKVNEPLPAVTTRKGRRGGTIKTAFAGRREAMDEASLRNEASAQRWRDFLAC